MTNELSHSGDTMLLNFSDEQSGLSIPTLSLAQSCIDALVIAKAGVGISETSVLTAIHDVFIGGQYGHGVITSEMRSIVPDSVLIIPFKEYPDRLKNQWLAERQRQYFQGMQLGGVTASRSDGADAYDKTFDSDLPSAMRMAGITRASLLENLQQMMFDEDSKVRIQAIKMAADMLGDGHVGAVHADRKRKENSAKIRIATKTVEQISLGGGSVHDAQNAAALEAYKMRMRKKGITVAEEVK